MGPLSVRIGRRQTRSPLVKGEPKGVHGVPEPPAPDPGTQSGPTPSAPYLSPKSRPVLLLVDDDAGVREALHLILDDDYAVLDAAHSQAALSMVRAEPVDLVLLDILMPDVDGIELLQELKV